MLLFLFNIDFLGMIFVFELLESVGCRSLLNEKGNYIAKHLIRKENITFFYIHYTSVNITFTNTKRRH